MKTEEKIPQTPPRVVVGEKKMNELFLKILTAFEQGKSVILKDEKKNKNWVISPNGLVAINESEQLLMKGLYGAMLVLSYQTSRIYLYVDEEGKVNIHMTYIEFCIGE